MKFDVNDRNVTDRHWLISDLHLGDKRVILLHDKRPWPDSDSHDRDIRLNCAAPAKKNRTLWLLGDIAFRRTHLEEFMKYQRPRWGRIILMRGNHDDKVAWRHRDWFDEAHEATYVRFTKNVKLYLSHYSLRTWRGSNHGSFHLHGHSHGALPRLGRSMDIGAPCIGYKPICLTECIEQLERQPHTKHH